MDNGTIEYIKDNLRYDPLTGDFWWTKSGSRRVLSKPAGSATMEGYRRIKIGGKPYKSHRLAFLFMGLDIPKVVDHINGNKGDNRWCNLRPACHTTNNFNKPKQRNNTSGFKRVGLHKPSGKWYAYIQINGVQKHLGSFDSPDEAHKAYCKAADNLAKEYANYGGT